MQCTTLAKPPPAIPGGTAGSWACQLLLTTLFLFFQALGPVRRGRQAGGGTMAVQVVNPGETTLSVPVGTGEKRRKRRKREWGTYEGEMQM